MAPTLGKRKREVANLSNKSPRISSDEREETELDAQEIFRRHFEAQFQPLPIIPKPKTVVEELDDEQDEQSDWDGISDGDENVVQVVEHTDTQLRISAMSKEELKAFMTSKPPSSNPGQSLIRDKPGLVEDDDPSEAANLKKDLALQRLLAESHLLESSKNPTLNGTNRHKATELRLQALGSKMSILKQEKMPMSHRRGIIAKQTEKEEKRRREARENGIILEKAKMKKNTDGKRDRGVGGPGIGKFSGGTLNLSKKDIFNIEGPRRSSSTRGGRGGGRGRGKRGR
ncbi:uncharacterized protein LY89DRAFT_592510 [Mollisia scopiformis]|uniref:Uncharacterized protein n=1 Tax=Mollisia scopiformis TaxID=149040 RepID=A0A194WYN2_MOLSC|nr:uncharacterized protein LY89DRAFT_592510 [Mollisia scopiformis]KUJ13068.1 hypothetical protein LY89DRAFT_592510 [Mollisia scopiformis]